MDHLEIFTDGSTVGRNGKLGTVTEIGVGFYIPALNVRFSAKEEGISNNVAELRAMRRALEFLIDLGNGTHPYERKPVVLYTDSMLAKNYFNNTKHSKKRHLQDELKELRVVSSVFWFIKAIWIPRDQNKTADALSKETIFA